MLLYAVFGDIIPEILEEDELSAPMLITLVTGGFIFATLLDVPSVGESPAEK